MLFQALAANHSLVNCEIMQYKRFCTAFNDILTNAAQQ